MIPAHNDTVQSSAKAREGKNARVAEALIERDRNLDELCRQPWTVVVGTVEQQVNSAILLHQKRMQSFKQR